MSASSLSFWTSAVDDPARAAGKAGFGQKLWLEGIQDGNNRRRIWRKVARPKNVARFDDPASGDQPFGGLSASGDDQDKEKLAAEVAQNVAAELEAALQTGMGPRMKDAAVVHLRVQQICATHAERNGLPHYEHGWALLVAIALSVLRNEQTATDMVQFLEERMRPFRANANEKLYADMLVLADVLQQDLPDLCRHFNQSGFDVVDLADIVCNWCKSFLASFFPPVAVIRMLDIFLFEGPSCWLGFAFGIIKVSYRSILAQQSEDVFAFVAELPNTLLEEHLNSALKIGHELLHGRQADRVKKLRGEKNWARALELPGAIEFVPGVGNRNMQRENKRLFEHKLGQLLDKELKDRSLGDLGGQLAGGRPGHTPSVIAADQQEAALRQMALSRPASSVIVDQLASFRQHTQDAGLKKLLGDTMTELTKQYQALAELQQELKNAEEKWHNSSLGASASSAESSISSDDPSTYTEYTYGDGDDSLATSPMPSGSLSGTTSSGAPLRRRSIMSGSGGGGGDGGAAEDPEAGTVLYSKLYQHQQFPCLYMEGYLLKARKSKGVFKRRGTTGLFGNLHRRFFVLQGSFLTYFKSHRNSKPSKDLSVDMRGRRVTLLQKHKFGNFGFEVSEKADRDECLYLLFASSDDERNVWAQVLEAACEG